MPNKTDIIELMLCLTTSVSDVKFIFGYFRLIIKPRHDDINGAIKLIKKIAKKSNIFTLKFIINIKLQINIIGIMIKQLNIILAAIDFSILIGKLLEILKLFPYSEIDDDVIEVIKVSNIIIQ